MDEASGSNRVQASAGPFGIVLGAEAMRALAEPVRALHALEGPAVTVGQSDIVAAPGVPQRLFCWAAGLPKAGQGVAVSVEFRPDGLGREHWHRRFGERRYQSTMRAGIGRDAGLLIEHFGLFDLLFALTVEPVPGSGDVAGALPELGRCGLRWRSVGWRLFGVALPRWAMPQVDALESGVGARFCFDIHVAFAWLGPVLSYKGWLERH